MFNKLSLSFLWIYWKFSWVKNKKTWKEVVKGLEKHEHKFTIPTGYGVMMCEHEGCYLCD